MSDATRLTPEEIQNYREQFKDYPEALDALNTVEKCKGELGFAAKILALKTGFEQSTLSPEEPDFFDNLLKSLRKTICSQYTDDTLELFKELKDFIPFPGSLIALVSIKVGQVTIREFCNRNSSIDQ
jgi:hypothetical protein